MEIGTPCSGPRSMPAASSRSAASGLRARLVRHHEDEGVEPAVVGVDPVQTLLDDRPRGQLAGAQLPAERFNGQRVDDVRHPHGH